jgi:hypothetical protein
VPPCQGIFEAGKRHRLPKMLFYSLLACLMKTWVCEYIGTKEKNEASRFLGNFTLKHLVSKICPAVATTATLKGPPSHRDCFFLYWALFLTTFYVREAKLFIILFIILLKGHWPLKSLKMWRNLNQNVFEIFISLLSSNYGINGEAKGCVRKKKSSLNLIPSPSVACDCVTVL